jgi:hypothetical protein
MTFMSLSCFQRAVKKRRAFRPVLYYTKREKTLGMCYKFISAATEVRTAVAIGEETNQLRAHIHTLTSCPLINSKKLKDA